jgi:hypothetical protein
MYSVKPYQHNTFENATSIKKFTLKNDFFRASAVLRSWESGRRIYEFIMTENMKAILRRNYDDVIKPYVEQGLIDERLVWSSTSFLALDEHYTR